MSNNETIEQMLQKFRPTGYTVHRQPDGSWLFKPILPKIEFVTDQTKPVGIVALSHKDELTRLMFSTNDPLEWIRYAIDHDLTDCLYEMMRLHSSSIAARGIRWSVNFPGHKI